MIPLVVPHIDHAVTEWMDTKVRPHLNLPEGDHHNEKEKKKERHSSGKNQKSQSARKVQHVAVVAEGHH